MKSARARLPVGFRVVIRDDVTCRTTADTGGRLLVGGSPLRAIRLSSVASGLLDTDSRTLTVRDRRSATLARRLLDGNIADPRPEAPEAADELTVVIPVKDRPEQLDRCLAALGGVSVIVVDDGSDDAAAVRRVIDRHAARLLRLPINRGPAAARNAGLAQVRTPCVAFVDSDITVEPSILLRMTTHFADPAVALVGPIVRGVARSRRPRWFERYDAASSSLTLGARACSVSAGAAVGWLPSACLVARVQALTGPDGVDGFAEDMRVGEDVDLVWRLVDEGWRVRYDPTCQAWHDARATLAGWLARKVVYGTGGAPLTARHGDATAVARLSPAMAAAGVAVLLRRAWAAPVAAIAVFAAIRTLRRSLPDGLDNTTIARIALRGLGWTLKQESALLLRHWWPATLLAYVMPSRAGRAVRRITGSALIVDTVAAFTVERPLGQDDTSHVGPVAVLAGRRLDDLAYGVGLWLGALRHRSPQALALKVLGAKPRP